MKMSKTIALAKVQEIDKISDGPFPFSTSFPCPFLSYASLLLLQVLLEYGAKVTAFCHRLLQVLQAAAADAAATSTIAQRQAKVMPNAKLLTFILNIFLLFPTYIFSLIGFACTNFICLKRFKYGVYQLQFRKKGI